MNWQNKFLVGALRGEKIVMFDISLDGVFVSRQDTFISTYGRLRNVIQGPDGSIYFSSGNVGYATMKTDDDKIYRLHRE